jgi:hypothetical protein
MITSKNRVANLQRNASPPIEERQWRRILK